MYEVATREFRTELHARWSAFFDHLDVPWVYTPKTFRSQDGALCTPAFWLPRERYWFDADPQETPAWWPSFALAAADSADQDDAPDFAFDVDEEWRGRALLWIGPPDVVFNSPAYLQYSAPESAGMHGSGGFPYAWTACPECRLLSAQLCGSEPECVCPAPNRDEAGHPAAVDLLGEAIRAASFEQLRSGASEEKCHPASSGSGERTRFVRRGLVPAEGFGEALRVCTAQCQSLADQWRAELPVGAYAEIPENGDALCGQCPGYVCTSCGERPVPGVGTACQVCEPRTLLGRQRARRILNTLAGQAAKLAGVPARVINALLNQETGARRRDAANLEQLAQALTLVEAWITDPSQIPPTAAARALALTAEDLAALTEPELRRTLNTLVGPLASASGEALGLVQVRLNDVMGVPNRSWATVEQLRDGIRQAQAWLADPASYRQHVLELDAAANAPVDRVPAPRRVQPATKASTCALCTSPIAEGDVTGHLENPGRTAPPGPLCAHCLHDRRAKPTRLDLVLRMFHQSLRRVEVRLNAAEAQVLLDWLLDVIPSNASTELQDVLLALQDAVSAQHAATRLRYEGTEAVIAALHAGSHHGGQDTETVILRAAARHFADWRTYLDTRYHDDETRTATWRQTVLEASQPPTVLSVRQPFPV